MELQDYTTEELKAELKRRAEAKRVKQQSVNRCRMCKHWGEITCWGNPTDENTLYGLTRYCLFSKSKRGKYKCNPGSALACCHFKNKDE